MCYFKVILKQLFAHFIPQVNDTKYADQTTLEVNVEDENDNHPVFSQQSYQVMTSYSESTDQLNILMKQKVERNVS